MTTLSSETLERSILDRLKNPYFALAFALLCMLLTVRHAASLYFDSVGLENPMPWDWVMVCLAISVLELSIIMLSVHGQERPAIVFSSVIFIVNLLYFWNGKELAWADWRLLLPGFLWSATFAYILYYYGELFVRLNLKEDKMESKNLELSNLKSSEAKLSRELAKQKDAFAKLQSELSKKEKYILELAGEVLTANTNSKATLYSKARYWKEKSQASGISKEDKEKALFRVQAIEQVIKSNAA